MLRLKDFVAAGSDRRHSPVSSGRKPSSDRHVASINSRTPKLTLPIRWPKQPFSFQRAWSA